MTETETANQGNGAAEQAPKVNMRILAQYMRDLSFENVAAQKKAARCQCAARYSGSG